MAEGTNNQLIADLARDQVARIAPQELPLFRPMSEAYFKNPTKTLKGETGKDEMLGFGEVEAIQLLTPYILAVMGQVVVFLTAEVKEALKEESGGVVSDIVKKLFKKFRPAEQDQSITSQPAQLPQSLTPEQLKQVHSIAMEKAQQLDLPRDQAELLADSIIGSLAVED